VRRDLDAKITPMRNTVQNTELKNVNDLVFATNKRRDIGKGGLKRSGETKRKTQKMKSTLVETRRR
jgi:hypothetical protein